MWYERLKNASKIFFPFTLNLYGSGGSFKGKVQTQVKNLMNMMHERKAEAVCLEILTL